MAKSGSCFSIDVKGQSTPNFWRIREKASIENLYYVLCLVTPERLKTRFFVLPQPQLNELLQAYRVSGVKYKPEWSGMNWGTAIPFEDRWDLLPI
ncbi:MAG: hypothetical protein GC155_14120 [Alphaproteobacteria bacterium]|nr:hypothetical protein [Alphaproteobacteria bacterium]